MSEYKNVELDATVRRPISSNKKIVLDFLQAIAERDVSGMRASVHEQSRWWVPPSGRGHITCPLEGVDAVIDLVSGQTLGTFEPGTTTWVVHHLVEEVDMVAAHMNRLARYSNGKPYENEYHLLFRIEDKVIIESWEVVDTSHARSQL